MPKEIIVPLQQRIVPKEPGRFAPPEMPLSPDRQEGLNLLFDVPTALQTQGVTLGCGDCVTDVLNGVGEEVSQATTSGSLGVVVREPTVFAPERGKPKKKVLVTGGAGYIGSVMTGHLLDQGYEVAVADSLEKGHKDAVDPRAKLHIGDLADRDFLDSVLGKGDVDAVIHFAGYIAVGESMREPGKYFHNNTAVTLGVLEAMKDHGVDKIIFSSTAAVYGNPVQVPIPESHPKNPTNPYGQSKLMMEDLLRWYSELHGTRYVALRYFNASGAKLDGSRGERHDPETHIIPLAILAALDGGQFNLFGNDYKTPDGTCVRDYIHVEDLARAHELALLRLQDQSGGAQFNVGTGRGYSNRDIVDTIKKVSGIDFPVIMKDRRPGDPDELVADASRIQQELGFQPVHSDLQTIISSAWQWHQGQHAKRQ